jgi:hypothetical protein
MLYAHVPPPHAYISHRHPIHSTSIRPKLTNTTTTTSTYKKPPPTNQPTNQLTINQQTRETKTTTSSSETQQKKKTRNQRKPVHTSSYKEQPSLLNDDYPRHQQMAKLVTNTNGRPAAKRVISESSSEEDTPIVSQLEALFFLLKPNEQY